MPLLELRDEGVYCATGDFYVDPWKPVKHAIITHAHSDHARPGSESYLTARAGVELLRMLIGAGAIQAVDYGQQFTIGDARVALYPAGHMLGSAQVRIEHSGEVWVISGDYQLLPNPSCAPWEPVRCDVFVTEGTFALPIFRWPDPAEVREAIHAWWRANQEAEKTSLLFANPTGMAQRLLTMLDSSLGPIHCHEEVEAVNGIYRAAGIPLVASSPEEKSLVIAPPEAHGTPWAKRFGTASTAMASGWMRIRGPRRRRSLDRGFVLSDHADWPGLLRAIEETRAEAVWVTSGYRGPLVRWLEEHGRKALAVETRFGEDEA